MEVKITKEINNIWDLFEFSWSGARSVVYKVIDLGRGEELMQWLEVVFAGEGVEDIELNDYLWFELEEEPEWSNLWNIREDEDDK